MSVFTVCLIHRLHTRSIYGLCYFSLCASGFILTYHDKIFDAYWIGHVMLQWPIHLLLYMHSKLQTATLRTKKQWSENPCIFWGVIISFKIFKIFLIKVLYIALLIWLSLPFVFFSLVWLKMHNGLLQYAAPTTRKIFYFFIF